MISLYATQRRVILAPFLRHRPLVAVRSACTIKLESKFNNISAVRSRRQIPQVQIQPTRHYNQTLQVRFLSESLAPAKKSKSRSPRARRRRRRQRLEEQQKEMKKNHAAAAATTTTKLPRERFQQHQQQHSIPTTHGPNGRPILTQDMFTQQQAKEEAQSGDANNSDLSNAQTVKNLLYRLQSKLGMTQEFSHSAQGPHHEQLFLSTITLTIPKHVVEHLLNLNLSSSPSLLSSPSTCTASSFMLQEDGSMQLQSTGAAWRKKRAEFLAAVDALYQLKEVCGIDWNNPPDIHALRRAQIEEQELATIQKAQMMLELWNSSHPQFETEKNSDEGGGGRFVSTVSVTLYKRNSQFLEATGVPGKSKKESKRNAMLALAKELPSSNKYDSLIEASPAKHISPLHVPKLPDEAIQLLQDVLGDDDDDNNHEDERQERRRELAEMKQAWLETQQRTTSRVGGQNQQPTRRRRQAMNRKVFNHRLVQEEQARARRASERPDIPQGKLQAIRDALPIIELRENLIQALETEQVVVISGGTGSGKSTQCPQYILEDAIANGKGADTRIIVTQPRRIAAISVAERIAVERDEPIGNSVGYAVRFNQKMPREWGGSIEFVTTGILLRRLVNDPLLEGISHVMIDEVHERDIDTDFLLILLRDLLPKKPDLRIVLMSATLDAESFASYFDKGRTSSGGSSVPLMSVAPKPRHPVQVIHLEEMAGESSSLSEQSRSPYPPDLEDLAKPLLEFHDQQLLRELEEADAEESAATRLKSRSLVEYAGAELLSDSDSSDSDSDSESSSSDSDDEYDSNGPESIFRPQSSRADMLRRSVSARAVAIGNPLTAKHLVNEAATNREIGEITVGLIARLAQHVAQVEIEAGRKGSILCFLPGWDEINQAVAILDDSNPSLKEKIVVLPLHSTIPQDDQQRVFVPAYDGTVKVILATNIAESSVTIDDVLAIVDSGLVRELNFDPESVMSAMETVPISRASATQRLGRAGRVAPGKCYRIYSQGALQAMFERPTPEIQRTALEATCLNTCSMTNDGVATFLQRAMDPPKNDAVSFAMDRLVSLGAIDVDPTNGEETLSPIGRCLSRLPLDPATGKMLLMGCLLQCLDPVLTAAACFSSREVFNTPLGMRKEQRIVRQSFCSDSDLMANIRAYNEFETVLKEEGWDAAKQWAFDNFVSIGAMNAIRSVRSQLLNELRRIGLVDRSDLIGGPRKSASLRETAIVNQNTDIESLHVALWATGLPDNLAGRRTLGSFGTFRTRMNHHTGLHPSSVAFHRKPPKDAPTRLPRWFLYREMIMSSDVFLRGCTAIRPEQIVLFGGYSLTDGATSRDQDGRRPSSKKPLKVLDDWVVMESSCNDSIDLMSRAREEIQTALELKTMNPRSALPPASEEILDAVCELHEMLYEEELE